MTIYGTKKNSIDLWWRAPKEPNGEIGYYLYYWRSVSGNSTRKNLTLPKSVKETIITDITYLKAYTNYTIAVVAYNLRRKLSGAPSFVQGMTKDAGMKRHSSNCCYFSMNIVLSVCLIFSCSNCSYICCTRSYSWLIENSNISFSPIFSLMSNDRNVLNTYCWPL